MNRTKTLKLLFFIAITLCFCIFGSVFALSERANPETEPVPQHIEIHLEEALMLLKALHNGETNRTIEALEFQLDTYVVDLHQDFIKRGKKHNVKDLKFLIDRIKKYRTEYPRKVKEELLESDKGIGHRAIKTIQGFHTVAAKRAKKIIFGKEKGDADSCP